MQRLITNHPNVQVSSESHSSYKDPERSRSGWKKTVSTSWMTLDSSCSAAPLPLCRQSSSLSHLVPSLSYLFPHCKKSELSCRKSKHGGLMYRSCQWVPTKLRTSSFNTAHRCWLCTPLPCSYFMSSLYLKHLTPPIMKYSIFLKCFVVWFHSRPSHKWLPLSGTHFHPSRV